MASPRYCAGEHGARITSRGAAGLASAVRITLSANSLTKTAKAADVP